MLNTCKPKTAWYTKKIWCSDHGKNEVWPCSHMIFSHLTKDERDCYKSLGLAMMFGVVTVASVAEMDRLGKIARQRATAAGKI